jgi:transcription-repair coupling factor (superfamily II helicase)
MLSRQPSHFSAAIIAHAWHRSSPDHRHSADSTIWILCSSVHSQELLYESLLNWQPDALFLPEAEFAASENVLPDPEIAAERLAVLMEVGRGSRPTRRRGNARESRSSCAEDTARSNLPSPNFSAGRPRRWKTCSNDWSAAGYERVAQVTTRGQFAVRGGIVDLYSWQAQCRFRAEFFGDQIESLREFDIDTQTSVRD